MKKITLIILGVLTGLVSYSQYYLWKVTKSGGSITDSFYYKNGVTDSVYKKTGNSYAAVKQARTIYYPVWEMVSGKPTTLAGYGISDAASSSHTHTGVYQPADADLTTYAGITPSANAQSLLGAADYAAMRTQLSLVPGTNVLAPSGNGSALTGITGGQITGNISGNAGGLTTYPAQTQYTAYAAGTAYTLTATSAAVTFGTTSPAITIATAGTYLIYYDVQTNYNAATLAASRTVTYKLRRTNNTAADLTNSSIGFATQIITTLTFSPSQKQRVLIYTASAGDIIQLWGSISVLPTAGSVQANDASIVAIKLY